MDVASRRVGSLREIPLAQPSIGARERELVDQVLTSGVLALGPFARDFEEGVSPSAKDGLLVEQPGVFSRIAGRLTVLIYDSSRMRSAPATPDG